MTPKVRLLSRGVAYAVSDFSTYDRLPLELLYLVHGRMSLKRQARNPSKCPHASWGTSAVLNRLSCESLTLVATIEPSRLQTPKPSALLHGTLRPMHPPPPPPTPTPTNFPKHISTGESRVGPYSLLSGFKFPYKTL